MRVGPRCGTCFMLPFSRLTFWESYEFLKICAPQCLFGINYFNYCLFPLLPISFQKSANCLYKAYSVCVYSTICFLCAISWFFNIKSIVTPVHEYTFFFKCSVLSVKALNTYTTYPLPRPPTFLRRLRTPAEFRTKVVWVQRCASCWRARFSCADAWLCHVRLFSSVKVKLFL